jgi:hypothetical protein
VNTQTGLNKGLMVMLDTYSNLWSSSSVDSDFQGFTGLIDRTGANVKNNLRSQVTALAKYAGAVIACAHAYIIMASVLAYFAMAISYTHEMFITLT